MADFQFQLFFFSNHIETKIEEVWASFTSTINDFTNQCVPSKLIKSEPSMPWITQEINRLIRKHDKLYRGFKKTRDQEIREKLIQLRRQLKSNTKSAYLIYLEDHLGATDEESICKTEPIFNFKELEARPAWLFST